jgi:hypothetical protein
MPEAYHRGTLLLSVFRFHCLSPRRGVITPHFGHRRLYLVLFLTRKAFKLSEGGVNSAQASVTNIMAALEERAARLSLFFKRSPQPYNACVIGKIVGSMVRWTGRYANSLEDSYLDVSNWRGHPPLYAPLYNPDHPARIGGERFEFDLTTTGEHVWRPTSGREQRAYSADALADEILSMLLEKEREAHKH